MLPAAWREERLDALAEELGGQGTRVLTRRTDVSVLQDCEDLTAAAVEAFGWIEVLVNNAGIGTEAARCARTPTTTAPRSTST